MKKKTLVIAITAVIITLVAVCFIVTLTGGKKPAVSEPNTTESSDNGDVNINIPDDPTSGDNTTEPGDDPVVMPGTDETIAPDDNTVTAPIETGNKDNTNGGEPSVEENKMADIGKTDTTPANKCEDNVTEGQKDKGTVQTGPASGEDRNDALDEKKEQGKTDNPLPDTDTEDHPVIVGDETSTTDTESKGDVVVGDESTGNGNGDKNAPEYVDPATGGDNPFANGGDNGVTEIPAEDLIGDDDPKPGEGIHF